MIAGIQFDHFDARHGVKKKTMSKLGTGLSQHRIIDAMPGVEKLINFIPVTNCTTSANKPSNLRA